MKKLQRFLSNMSNVIHSSHVLCIITNVVMLPILIGVFLGAVIVYWKIAILLLFTAYIARLIYAGFTGK